MRPEAQTKNRRTLTSASAVCELGGLGQLVALIISRLFTRGLGQFVDPSIILVSIWMLGQSVYRAHTDRSDNCLCPRGLGELCDLSTNSISTRVYVCRSCTDSSFNRLCIWVLGQSSC